MGRLFRKHSPKQERRRPVDSGGSTGSFSYYSSKRSTISSRKEVTTRVSLAHPQKQSRFTFSQLGFSKIGHRLGSILLAVVLLTCVVSVLQVDTTPRVVVLNASAGVALHDSVDYQKVVTDSLRSSLLNSNKITVNTQRVVNDLQAKFPEIYDASLVLPLVGHRPTIYIELTRPALVLQTAGTSTVVDSSGRALMVSASIGTYSSLKLPVIHDQSNITAKVGNVALPSSNVAFIEDIIRQCDSQGMLIDKIVLPAGAEELDVYPKGVQYYVRFNTHETNSRQQAGTFFAVRQQLQKQGTSPKQYIDARIAGRAYYL